jgi:phosphatidate cytidylyltransferase
MASKKVVFLSRLSSTLVLWTVALWIIFSGFEIGFFCLIGVLGLVGLWEFFRMLDHKELPNHKITALICGFVSLCGSFYYYRTIGPGRSYDFEMAVIVVFLLVVFARQMFERTRDVLPLEKMAFTLFGLLYVIWLFNFVTKIVYVVPRTPEGAVTGHVYVFYLIVITKFSDMGAYLTGSLIGKHLLIPHISPAKTWEGFFGALVFATIGSYAVFFFLGDQLTYLDWTHATVLGVLLGFSAIIGDLAESIIKRSTGVKDSGNFLPGIGGALDLIDSLLFTAPLLFFYLRLVLHVPTQ